MKLNTILEARYHNQPDEKHLKMWKNKMITAIEDDWYNGYDSWEDFVENGLGNPSNSIEDLWEEVPEQFRDWYEAAYEDAVDYCKDNEDE